MACDISPHMTQDGRNQTVSSGYTLVCPLPPQRILSRLNDIVHSRSLNPLRGTAVEHLSLTRALPPLSLLSLCDILEPATPEWAPPSSSAAKLQESVEPENPLDFYESWQGISW